MNWEHFNELKEQNDRLRKDAKKALNSNDVVALKRIRKELKDIDNKMNKLLKDGKDKKVELNSTDKAKKDRLRSTKKAYYNMKKRYSEQRALIKISQKIKGEADFKLYWKMYKQLNDIKEMELLERKFNKKYRSR